MADKTGIEWTDATWPDRTVMRFVESDGTPRAKIYHRLRTDRPGTAERRLHAAYGERWCQGCLEWLSAPEVTKQGLCSPHANEEYRRRYALNSAPIRAQKYARKRKLATIPPDWAAGHLETFGGLCAYGCGRQSAGMDHVWPVNRGGESRPGNIVPACARCNSQKSDDHPAPWIERGWAAFPEEWAALGALALEHGSDEWLEEAVAA